MMDMMHASNPTTNVEILDEIMKQYLKLKENEKTTTEQWIEFTIFIANNARNFVQKAISTKEKEHNKTALRLCNMGLLAAHHVGTLHPVIPQLAFEAGLLHFQARQFFKAGQLFFLAHRSFKQLGNEDHAKKSLNYCNNAFLTSIKEFLTVAVRLTLDYYHDIGWNYLIRSVRSVIALLRARITSMENNGNLDDDISRQLQAMTDFLKNEEGHFDSKQASTLQQLIDELKKFQQLDLQTLSKKEREILKLLPSSPRMLLIIYEDGRLVYGYDFENDSDNSPFLVMMAGILFAIISLLSIELKVGTLNQLQTEEGIALVQKHDNLFFFLLCTGEPGSFRNKFQSFIEEFIQRYSTILHQWKGELRFQDTKSLIELLF